MRYRYRSDDELKDSGVEWLGKIPKDWEVKRNRHIFDFRRREINEYEDTTVLSLTINGVKVKTDLNFGKSTESYIGHQLVYPGDIVFTPRDFDQTPILSGVSNHYGCISNLYFVLKCKNNINNYFVDYFWWGLKYKVDFFKNFSYGIRYGYNYDQFKDLLFLNPSYMEQEKIANFLDEKTSQFDLIISKKEKLIERLEESKKSLISEVVTGKVKVVKTDDGYELMKRSSEEMKDSGVEWLGEIPKDWEVKKLKYITDVKGRIGFRGYTKEDLVDEGMGALAIGASQISSKGMLDLSSPTYISWEKYFESPEIMLNNDDILLVQRGSTTGKIGIVESLLEKSTINPSLVIIKKPKSTFAKYLFYYLKSRFIESHFNSITSSTAIPMISQEQILNIFICTPIKEEQEIIYNLLDIKSNEIDETTDKIKLQIEKLKQAKQSLISEAVTGKIEILD